MKNFISIAIDGPAAAGKSTVAKKLAKELGFIYVDTGAMYRAMAVCLISNGIDAGDDEGIRKACKENSVTLEYRDGEQRVLLNGADVTGELRMEEVGKAASTSSKHPVLREKMTEMQRKLAETENVIMDGRDIGTVVLPDASLKIFMTADPDERAIRRFRELQGKGESVSLLEVIRDMNARDLQDSTREIAPLKPAEDAFEIDTTVMSVEQVVMRIHSLINHNIKQEWMKKWWLEYRISDNLTFSGWFNTIHTCTKPEIPDMMQGTFSVSITNEGIRGTFLPDNPDFCENRDFHVFGYVLDQYNYPVCCGPEFSARLEDCIVPDKSYSMQYGLPNGID